MADQDATTDEAPTSAVVKVFAVPELLELILLHTIDGQHRLISFSNPKRGGLLRPSPERLQQLRALLVNQRVARTFAAIIPSSRNLREALFFTHERCDSNGKYKSNPAINKLVMMPSAGFLNPRANPAWTRINWADAGAEDGTLYLQRWVEGDGPSLCAGLAQLVEQPSVGSWRKMLLVSQPMKIQVTTQATTRNGMTTSDESWDRSITVGQSMGESFLLSRWECGAVYAIKGLEKTSTIQGPK
ncbi:hypothetical protein LTR17_000984 [Elasticomyces elasticus]|nr:hypothetical protein LTR17_000984 [Elasticomyces elasticus]